MTGNLEEAGRMDKGRIYEEICGNNSDCISTCCKYHVFGMHSYRKDAAE